VKLMFVRTGLRTAGSGSAEPSASGASVDTMSSLEPTKQ
jgi:hypothetical protein